MHRYLNIAIISLALLCFFIISRDIYALDEETHKLLNEKVAKGNLNNFSLDLYLKNDLKIDSGIEETYEGYAGMFDAFKETHAVWKWIRLGGEHEDKYPSPVIHARSFMHFHDPLKPLNIAGFNSAATGQRDSSITWALSRNAQSGLNLGNYSWYEARGCFYDALTATDVNNKNEKFAKCFRSVGQLMHLVEDASVPEHTKNEGHPFGFHYEKWVADTKNSSIIDGILAGNPVIPYSTVLATPGYPEFEGLPISRLFDTDNYDGQYPGITTSADIGMAEYTNANFFSRHDVASGYAYPRNALLYEFDEQIQDPRNPGTITRYFYGKNGDGEPVQHLAAIDYFKDASKQYSVQQFYNDTAIFLDETCYRDYATKLLPRAVGYASSLMQYFFRGDVDAVGATTVTNANGEITGMTTKVRNKTLKIGGNPDEKESIGGEPIDKNKLTVAYEYKQGSNTVYGKSDPLTFDNYSGHQYEFTNFTQPIPADATDKKFMLVYRGKLGDENDAVTGKSFDVGYGDIYFSGSHQETFIFNQSAVIVYRVKRTTGEIVWKYYWSILQNCTEDSGPLMNDYVLHAVSKNAVYVSWNTLFECPNYDGPDAWYLDKLDKDTGQRIWRVREEPVYYDETENISADSTGVYIMKYHGFEHSPSTMHIVKYSSGSGSLLWDITLPTDTYWRQARVYADENGVIYAFSAWQAGSPTTVVCIDRDTGVPIWSRTVSGQLSSRGYVSELSVNSNYIVLNTNNGLYTLDRSDGNIVSLAGGYYSNVAAQSERILEAYADEGYYYTLEGAYLKSVNWEQFTDNIDIVYLFPLKMGLLRNDIVYLEDGAHSYAKYHDDNGNMLWKIELENLPYGTPGYGWTNLYSYHGYGCMFIGNATYDATADKLGPDQ